MNTKKAIIIGTLSAILVGLCSFAYTKFKPKTTTPVINKIDHVEKNKIQSETLTNGFNFEMNPHTDSNGDVDTAYYQNPTQFTKQLEITNLTNTTWYFNEPLNNTAPSGTTMNEQHNPLQSETYHISFTQTNQTSPTWTYLTFTSGTNSASLNFGGNPIYYWRHNQYELNVFKTFNNITTRSITITDGTDVTNENLINWLLNNATLTSQQPTTTFLASRKTESSNTTYASFQYTTMNQKTFVDKVKEEGIFIAKIVSGGISEVVNMTEGFFVSQIPYRVQGKEYTSTIKISKLPNIDTSDFIGNTYNQFQSYENYYNNLPNKTNIYSGTYKNTYDAVHNYQTGGTYSNETGTRIANAMSEGGSGSHPLFWSIYQQDFSIMTAGRVNFIAVYYSFETQDLTQPDNTYGYADVQNNYVGYSNQIEGYSIASLPAPPPSPDIEDGNFTSLAELMLSILTMPFTFMTKAFDLTLWEGTPWAFNIKNFIFTVIAIMAFLFIIKLFTSGFSVLGNFTNNRNNNKLTKSQTELNKAKTEKIKNESKKE